MFISFYRFALLWFLCDCFALLLFVLDFFNIFIVLVAVWSIHWGYSFHLGVAVYGEDYGREHVRRAGNPVQWNERRSCDKAGLWLLCSLKYKTLLAIVAGFFLRVLSPFNLLLDLRQVFFNYKRRTGTNDVKVERWLLIRKFEFNGNASKAYWRSFWVISKVQWSSVSKSHLRMSEITASSGWEGLNVH